MEFFMKFPLLKVDWIQGESIFAKNFQNIEKSAEPTR